MRFTCRYRTALTRVAAPLHNWPMRLLPSTRHGTWLTALVVWLAGAATIWWAFPARPRCVIPDAVCWNFVAEGLRIVATESRVLQGPFSIWDLTTGQQI